MEVTALWRYPVKSLAPLPADLLQVEPWGAAGDRRWAVLDGDGPGYLTARAVRQMFRVAAEPTPDGIRLTCGERSLAVATPHDGPRVEVAFSRLSEAVDAGEEAAAFLTEALGRPARLVWQPDPTQRPVNPAHGGRPGESVSLADVGPLLLTTQASLAAVEVEAGVLDMRRFRPNVVIDGGRPWAEDAWSQVTIGEVAFRVLGSCDRCAMTLIDPDTLETSREPIRTLARVHAWGGSTYFGVWLIPQATGKVSLGDQVTAR